MIETHVKEDGAFRTLTFSKLLPAPPEQVYRAFTNEVALREWLVDHAHVDDRVDGPLFLGWDRPSYYYAVGRFTRLDPPRHVAFDWQGLGEPGATHVTVDIEEQRNGTLVTLTHSRIGMGEAWDQVLEEARQGWLIGLENLQAHLETGRDLRLVRRPYLGIFLEDENVLVRKDAADGPVPRGVLVGGVITGTGAARADLRNGDIITGLAGERVQTEADVIRVLDGLQAGDVIDVEVYRDGQMHTTRVELSQRPLPEVPDSADVLADRLKEIYDGLALELGQLLHGASDRQASKRPSKDEWSVNEVLAHLIHVDRDRQFWLATIISGREVLNFPDNVEARIQATTHIYPKLEDLEEELRRTWGETVAMVRRLPKAFVKSKRTYYRVGEVLLNSALHSQKHFEQIKQALEAAG